MKVKSFTAIALKVLFILILAAQQAFPQTTEFSYQGFITDNNASANGSYDFEFKLYDAPTGGNLLGTLQRTNVTVANGVFSTTLDFPSQPFTGGNRFLEISVRPSGGGTFTTLTPRQKVLSAPYAIFSGTAQVSIDSTRLGNIPSTQYVLTSDPRLSDARIPLPNSVNYIQNRTTPQSSSHFNISGNGTVGGTLTGNIVSATTQFNLGLNRVLSKVGQNNLYVGTLAGAANGGIQNTLVGDGAGQDNTGDENVLVGFVTGQRNTTGNGNTFVGSRAGKDNTLNTRNTFIGANATGSNGLTNATAIGANAFVTQNNTIVLGSVMGINGGTANTDVGIGITNPARRLDVNGIIRVGSTTGNIGCIEDRDGTVIAGTCASDERFKKNITSIGRVLDNFVKLRPVNYFWKTEEFKEKRFGSGQSFGLIAQEVEPLFPELVSTDEDGFKMVNYTKLPLYTIQAVKELKDENDSLKRRLESQQAEIEELKKTVRQISASVSKPKISSQKRKPRPKTKRAR
jgi:hypothetical protein